MNFNQLSWGAVCFYYRSIGDNRYSKVMRDTEFIAKLREEPFNLSSEEFEKKVLLSHIDIENYDLLIGHDLARRILGQIIELQPTTVSLQNVTLQDCDLTDPEIVEKISRVYAGLYSINGLWLTGASKIAHLLNDHLFAILNLDISSHFGLLESGTGLTKWLSITQQNVREVTKDFQDQGFTGSPDKYLSDKLGYSSYGYQKSLVKFIDEYFWLRFGDNLPVPPKWIPLHPAKEAR